MPREFHDMGSRQSRGKCGGILVSYSFLRVLLVTLLGVFCRFLNKVFLNSSHLSTQQSLFLSELVWVTNSTKTYLISILSNKQIRIFNDNSKKNIYCQSQFNFLQSISKKKLNSLQKIPKAENLIIFNFHKFHVSQIDEKVFQ